MAGEKDEGPKTGTAAVRTPAAETEEEWPLKVTLRKPIMAHGDKLTVLELREPTGGDIERFGDPVWYDVQQNPPRMHIHEANMAAMIGGLASIPPSSVKAMSPKDWKSIAWEIAPFFVPGGVA